MLINCVICSDFLTQSSDIFVTQCGHMFHYACLMNWLERSKTCPQCRNRSTEKTIHRLYLNFSTTEHLDVGALNHKIDNLQFQVTLKEKNIKELTEKASAIKAQNIGLRDELQESERKLRITESAIHALKDQVSYFKTRSKDTSRLTEEVMRLKKQIHEMENVHLAINGSREQVNDILRNERNIESLALLVATLKKSLLDAEKRKLDMEFKYKHMQNDSVKYRREITSLERKNADLKRDMESAKSNWEEEKQHMRNKISEKLSEMDNSLDPNTSLKRMIAESPIPLHRKLRLNPVSGFIDFNKTQSPSLDEKIKIISESDSPYLPVKSSSVGIDFNTKYTTKPSTSKFSIFKQPQTKLDNVKLPSGNTNKEVSYDGLGGSSKEDIFPTAKPKQVSLKRHKSSSSISATKFRKLAPSGKFKTHNYFSQDADK